MGQGQKFSEGRKGNNPSKASRPSRPRPETGWGRGSYVVTSHLSPLSDSDTRRSYKRGRDTKEAKGEPLPAAAVAPSTRTTPQADPSDVLPRSEFQSVARTDFFEPYGFSSMSCSSTGSLMRSPPPLGGASGSDPYQLFSPWNTGALRLLQSGAKAGPEPGDATRGSRPEDLAHDPRTMNQLNGRKVKHLSVTVDLMSPDLKKQAIHAIHAIHGIHAMHADTYNTYNTCNTYRYVNIHAIHAIHTIHTIHTDTCIYMQYMQYMQYLQIHADTCNTCNTCNTYRKSICSLYVAYIQQYLHV